MAKMNPEVCTSIGGRWDSREHKCIPPPGKLLVKRESYIREPYTRSDGIHIGRTDVPITYMIIKDTGAPGRGPKVITINKRGTLSQYGYSIKEPATVRHRALGKAVDKYGAKVVYHKLQAMANLREKAGEPGAHPRRGKEKEWRTFRADRNYVKDKYHPDLTPTKAIKARAKARK